MNRTKSELIKGRIERSKITDNHRWERRNELPETELSGAARAAAQAKRDRRNEART